MAAVTRATSGGGCGETLSLGISAPQRYPAVPELLGSGVMGPWVRGQADE